MTNVVKRTFDRIPVFDEKSKLYSVAPILDTSSEEVEKLWDTGPIINQGSEGACVGFAWTNELTAEPFPDIWADVDVATTYAFNHYHRAREVDEFPNEVYTSGSSVLAGAKVALERGFIEEYRWAFGTEYIVWSVIQKGPVVLGVPWYWEMYNTDEAGRVIVHHDMNNFVGGHAITLTGYYPKKEFIYSDGRRETVERVFRWTNSWGPSYGLGGHGYITFDDLHILLNTYGHKGEACLPMLRKEVDLARFLDPTLPPRPEPEEPKTMSRGKLIDHALRDLNLWLERTPKGRRRFARLKVRIAKRALRELPLRER